MRVMLAMLLALLVFVPARAQDAAKAPTTSPDQPGPSKFYGTISAVDKTAKTFTVDNKVYHVVAETSMTKAADDSKATLDDAAVGEPARGTYTQASDATLNVTKVRFGKKAGGGKANGKGGKNGKKAEATTQTQSQ